MDSKTKKLSPPRDPTTGKFVKRESPQVRFAPIAMPGLEHQLQTWAKEDEQANKAIRRTTLLILGLVLLGVVFILLVLGRMLSQPAAAAELPSTQSQFVMDMCRARVAGALVTQELLKSGEIPTERYQVIQTTILGKLAQQDPGTLMIAESTTTTMACHLLTADLILQGILTPAMAKMPR